MVPWVRGDDICYARTHIWYYLQYHLRKKAPFLATLASRIISSFSLGDVLLAFTCLCNGWEKWTKHIHKCWAPASCKWSLKSYNLFKWPYEWVIRDKPPISGVLGPQLNWWRDPLCTLHDDFHLMVKSEFVVRNQIIPKCSICGMYPPMYYRNLSHSRMWHGFSPSYWPIWKQWNKSLKWWYINSKYLWTPKPENEGI